MKQAQFFLSILLITGGAIGLSIAEDVTVNEDPVQPIVEFLQEMEKKVELGAQKDIVLIVGNGGGGRTTLSLLLSEQDIDGIESKWDDNAYITADKNNRINPDFKSHQLIPELMVDNSTGTVYVDCNGFIDSRGLEYDILASHLIQRLLSLAHSVKFVFVVPSFSAQIGGDPQDFMELAQHATNMIKNLDKYQNAISLVITKLDNYNYMEDSMELISEEELMKTKIHFLNKVKGDIERVINGESERNQYNYEEIYKLLEIFLKQNGENYPRIGLLRRPPNVGSVKEMPLLQSEKIAIKTIVNENLQFVRTSDDDFEYTISRGSQERLYRLSTKMIDIMVRDMENIGNEIQHFYLQKEKQCTNYTILWKEMDIVSIKLFAKLSKEPKLVFSQINTNLNEFGIRVSSEISDAVLNHLNSYAFTKKFYNLREWESERVTRGLQNTIKTLIESVVWYNFTTKLDDALQDRTVQKNIIPYLSDLNNMLDEFAVAENEMKDIDETGLGIFLDRIGSNLYYEIANMRVNSYKMAAVKNILQKTLNTNLLAAVANMATKIDELHAHLLNKA